MQTNSTTFLIDSDKKLYSFFIVEDKSLYNFENYSDIEYFKKNLSHRNKKTVQIIYDTYCGVTTWADVQTLFPAIDFPDTIEEVF